jgi:hypothetical protein
VIVKLDEIDQRLVGMRQELVDHNRVERIAINRINPPAIRP